ncbi:hypothetical protein [Pseudomonas sp. NPDC096950]|uniref:hypothetical protein n=1 Tax=Pseudomonas sp. NPDC096950 TaxID=3364485 RepID=UPI00383A3803
MTNREVALEQALVAILGAAIASGLDLKMLMDRAVSDLRGNASCCGVGYPHASNAILALCDAHSEALTKV